jgi:hypothetical protein
MILVSGHFVFDEGLNEREEAYVDENIDYKVGIFGNP